MYVDDLISSKTNVKGTQQLKQEATDIFQDACFTLQKWHSNDAKLEEPIATVTGEQSFAKQKLPTPGSGGSSILGLAWNKRDDEISVNWRRCMIHWGLRRLKHCKESLFTGRCAREKFHGTGFCQQS